MSRRQTEGKKSLTSDDDTMDADMSVDVRTGCAANSARHLKYDQCSELSYSSMSVADLDMLHMCRPVPF